MKHPDREKYIKFGCSTLVNELNQKDQVLQDCMSAIDSTLLTIKQGKPLSDLQIKKLEQASGGCLLHLGM